MKQKISKQGMLDVASVMLPSIVFKGNCYLENWLTGKGEISNIFWFTSFDDQGEEVFTAFEEDEGEYIYLGFFKGDFWEVNSGSYEQPETFVLPVERCDSCSESLNAILSLATKPPIVHSWDEEVWFDGYSSYEYKEEDAAISFINEEIERNEVLRHFGKTFGKFTKSDNSESEYVSLKADVGIELRASYVRPERCGSNDSNKHPYLYDQYQLEVFEYVSYELFAVPSMQQFVQAVYNLAYQPVIAKRFEDECNVLREKTQELYGMHTTISALRDTITSLEAKVFELEARNKGLVKRLNQQTP